MADGFVLGVDVGGTFTDICLISLSNGEAFYFKTPSTTDDPSRAIELGIREILCMAGAEAAEVSFFGHGTTVATNALIEGSVARTALITTDGFRDLIEIRRQRQPHHYDVRKPKPTPLVPRQLRREVRERTYLDGRRPVEPDLHSLSRVLAEFDDEGVEAVAICFLHSYSNPMHENEVAAFVRERMPRAFVCKSHEIVAEFREYERCATTITNSSLGPVMARYLRRLEERAEAIGVRSPQILQSNGGLVSAGEAGLKPVATLASGPAAGVAGAVHLAAKEAARDIITFDVGGTSTDVCLIADGAPSLAHLREFRGYPVRFPTLDVQSVGAGGGSVGWVDAGRFLHVGPQSAGAKPGPACYGLGGTEATVTDANLVLGRLPSNALLGGRLPVDMQLARSAIASHIARPMQLSVEDAAAGVLTILNESLVRAIRGISVEKGFDPRRFTLIAFGGAGPLLASDLAKELGIGRVLVPTRPGLLCALGLLLADLRSDFSRTQIATLELSNAPEFAGAFAQLEAQAAEWFEREGIEPARRNLAYAVDMRFEGQSHELTIPAAPGSMDLDGISRLAHAFRMEHERNYGYQSDEPIELVTYRLTASARYATPPISEGTPGHQRDLAPTNYREVYFKEAGGFVRCPVFDRSDLSAGNDLEGPAIIEQMDTTTVVLPGQTASVGNGGILTLTF